ncbi:MAG: HNH endonuclease [Vicinamibacterales bacterium]
MSTAHLDFTRLSDVDLLTEGPRLVTFERHAAARVVAYLAELDKRRLYLGLGFTSLFKYCTEALHLSEDATLNRIEAARAARRFPAVFAELESGYVTLTAVRLLAPHLTPENHERLLAAARHKGLKDIQYLLAKEKPQPPVPSTIRKLPTKKDSSTSPVPAATIFDSAVAADPPPPDPKPAPMPKRAVVAPLSEVYYKVQVTFRRETHDKLRKAQALLRHQIPSGDPALVLDRALDSLIAELSKKKCAAVNRPQTPRPREGNSRSIPAHVKRAVWTRDGGECAFQGTDGRRCGETGCLEYHHVVPYAAGGQATVENIELRCRAHNGYEAEVFFGPGKIPRVRESAAVYA